MHVSLTGEDLVSKPPSEVETLEARQQRPREDCERRIDRRQREKGENRSDIRRRQPFGRRRGLCCGRFREQAERKQLWKANSQRERLWALQLAKTEPDSTERFVQRQWQEQWQCFSFQQRFLRSSFSQLAAEHSVSCKRLPSRAIPKASDDWTSGATLLPRAHGPPPLDLPESTRWLHYEPWLSKQRPSRRTQSSFTFRIVHVFRLVVLDFTWVAIRPLPSSNSAKWPTQFCQSEQFGWFEWQLLTSSVFAPVRAKCRHQWIAQQIAANSHMPTTVDAISLKITAFFELQCRTKQSYLCAIFPVSGYLMSPTVADKNKLIIGSECNKVSAERINQNDSDTHLLFRERRNYTESPAVLFSVFPEKSFEINFSLTFCCADCSRSLVAFILSLVLLDKACPPPRLPIAFVYFINPFAWEWPSLMLFLREYVCVFASSQPVFKLCLTVPRPLGKIECLQLRQSGKRRKTFP